MKSMLEMGNLTLAAVSGLLYMCTFVVKWSHCYEYINLLRQLHIYLTDNHS